MGTPAEADRPSHVSARARSSDELALYVNHGLAELEASQEDPTAGWGRLKVRNLATTAAVLAILTVPVMADEIEDYLSCSSTRIQAWFAAHPNYTSDNDTVAAANYADAVNYVRGSCKTQGRALRKAKGEEALADTWSYVEVQIGRSF